MSTEQQVAQVITDLENQSEVDKQESMPPQYRLLLVDSDNILWGEIPEDNGDYIPLFMHSKIPIFKFPMSKLKELLENCDVKDVINMIGEDSVISQIDINSIVRVISFSEISSVFAMDGFKIDQEWLDKFGMSTLILDNDLIWNIAKDRNLFIEYIEDNEYYTWSHFLDTVEIDDLFNKFPISDILSYIHISEVLDHFGLGEVLEACNIRDIVDSVDYTDLMNEICRTATGSDILEWFELSDILADSDIEEILDILDTSKVVNTLGAMAIVEESKVEDLLEEIDDADIAEYVGPSIMRNFTAKEIAKIVPKEKIEEALRLKIESEK